MDRIISILPYNYKYAEDCMYFRRWAMMCWEGVGPIGPIHSQKGTDVFGDEFALRTPTQQECITYLYYYLSFWDKCGNVVQREAAGEIFYLCREDEISRWKVP